MTPQEQDAVKRLHTDAIWTLGEIQKDYEGEAKREPIGSRSAIAIRNYRVLQNVIDYLRADRLTPSPDMEEEARKVIADWLDCFDHDLSINAHQPELTAKERSVLKQRILAFATRITADKDARIAELESLLNQEEYIAKGLSDDLTMMGQRAEALQAERDGLREKLTRLGSSKAMTSSFVIDKTTNEGRELDARITFAREALGDTHAKG